MKNFFKAAGTVAGYLALYILIMFIVTLGVLAAGLLTGLKSMNDTVYFLTSHILEITVISDLSTLLVCLLIQKLRKRKLAEYLELKIIPFGRLWPVVTFGLSFNIIIGFLITYLPLPKSIIDDYSSAAGTLNVGSPMMSIIATVIVAPLFEEILFRGLILNALRKVMPLAVAVIIQALLFGLMHGQIIWSAYSFLFGILLAAVRLSCKSLLASITLHISFNALSVFMMVLTLDLPGSLFADLLIFAFAAMLAAFSVWKFIGFVRMTSSEALPETA